MLKAKILLKKLDNFINDNFFGDYHNWILWCPVIFGFGILTYFRFPNLNISVFIAIFLLCLILLIIFRKNKEYLTVIFSVFLFVVGYVDIYLYTEKLNFPKIKYNMGYVDIYGIAEDISYYQKNNETRVRIVVEVDKINKVKRLNKDQRVSNNKTAYFTKDGVMHNIPKNVRINMSSKSEIPAFGEYVKIRANLIPIPKQAFHGAYNIERVLYFQGIGGIGFNGYLKERGLPKMNTIYDKIKYKIYNIREKLNNRIIKATGSESGPVVGSFITGIRGRISSTNYNNMTYAGLAHLISISGLHMAIVMGFTFSIVRRILVYFENFTLTHDIKKISAIFAIIVGFVYLCMTGFPISANRAYIMSVLFFISILIEREIDSLRFLALSAFLLLFCKPNFILEPSFQLSFLAVLGLVSGYKFLGEHNVSTFTKNKFLKPLYYLFGVLLSSIITEISVSPIAIYHFNNYTPFNMLTNLVAIPLVGFITLPLATISVLLMPFNFEKILLIPAGISIDIVLKISKYVVSLPYATYVFPSPSLLGISLILFGFLWFTLWEQKWRYFGVVLFASGIIVSVFKETPDIIIDKKDKFVVIVRNNALYFSRDSNDYKVSTIEKKFGQKNHNNFVQYCYDFQDNNLEYCKKFIYDINTIFRNEDIVENFRELNIKYKVFDKDLKVLLNETN